MDTRALCRAAGQRLFKDRAMGYGHTETDSDRLCHGPELRADPPTPPFGRRFVNEPERRCHENENK
jgi:hypothetical protein